jgi:hypothetical protein
MILAAVTVSLLQPEPFVVGDLRTSGDWTVGCAFLLACHATSMPEEEYCEGADCPAGDGRLSVSIKSKPIVGTFPVVEFTLLEGSDLTVHAAAMKIAVDDRVLGLPIQGENGLFRLNGTDALAFVLAARNGRTVSLIDANGAEIAAASLRGLRQALAFIDRQQYRTGTTASYAEPGPVAWDYSVAPVFAPRQPIRVAGQSARPPVTASAEILARLEELDPCKGSSPPPEREKPRSFRLDEAHSLLIFPTRCGGYNPYRLLFVLDETGAASQARFRPWPGHPKDTEPDLPDPYWDEATRRLHTFGRGRVLGDCGAAAEYVWDRGAFSLVQFRSLYPCRGSYDYITTWEWPVRIEAAEDETVPH